MSAAGMPVCLTRPPKLALHPPPVSKSEIQSIPAISHTCRKTTKKQAKKGEPPPALPTIVAVGPPSPALLTLSPTGKAPEEVLKKYLQKVRHPPDEVRAVGPAWAVRRVGGGSAPGLCYVSAASPRGPSEEGLHAPGTCQQAPIRSPQDCTICMERLSAPSGYKGPQPAVKPDLVGKLAKCGHIFHLHCLVAMYNNGNKV